MLRMTQPTSPATLNGDVYHLTSSSRIAQSEPLISPGSVVGVAPITQLHVVPWHDHDFYEVGLVTQGSGYHFCGAREEPFQPGTVIFVPPGVAHGYRAREDVVVYNCFFRAELPEFELLWAARDGALTTLFGRGVTRPDHVMTHLDPDGVRDFIAELDAIREIEPADRSRAIEIGHLLLALDIITRRGQSPDTLPRATRPAMPRIVSAAVELIDQDPARHWALADLSREVYVGSFHLAHEFKRCVGMSPIAYVNQRRVERAAVLLAGTDDPIGDIGRAVGWPDPASLSRHFHKAFGVSPREYRRRRDGSLAG